MTRLLVDARLPLTNWLRGNASLGEWILALDSIRKDWLLVAGGNERMRRTLFENLEQLGSDTAAAIIQYYQKLPRTSGDGTSADCSLADQVDASRQNALTNLVSNQSYRQALDNRRAAPERFEEVLDAFDRILLPIARAASEITIVDQYISAELFKPGSATSKIVSERFGELPARIRLHSVTHKEKGDNVEIRKGAKRQIPLPENVKLILHYGTSSKKDTNGKTINFPHARVWRFDFSQGNIVINLDKGFETFMPSESGVIVDVSDPTFWVEKISEKLAATRIF